MYKIPLLPGYFRWIGASLVLFTILLYLFDSQRRGIPFNMRTFVLVNETPFQETSILSMSEVDITLTVLLLSLLLGLAFITFARKKVEDEMMNTLRLYAWSWSIIIMMAANLIVTVLVFGIPFASFAILFPHALLVCHLAIFHISLRRLNAGVSYEK